jgi:YidC/Oxa1 family membrane protein insertase
MQDQAKRLMLAVGLALVVMVAWNQFFSPPPPDKPAGTLKTPLPGAPAAEVLAPARSQAGLGLSGKQVELPANELERTDQRITLSFPNLTAEFSDRDAALVSWKLTNPKYQRDLSMRGEMTSPGPGRGLLLVNFARSTHVIPRGAQWKGEKLSDTQLRYTYRSDVLEVVKTFTLHPADYLVQLTVQAAVLSGGEAQQRLAVTSYGFQDPKITVEDGSEQTRAFMSSTLLANGEIAHTSHKSLVSSPRTATSFRWTGFDHPYLLIAMAPHPRAVNVEKLTTVTSDPGGIQTDVLYPMATMRTGEQPAVFEMTTFIGPKHYEQLERADKVAGFTTGFKDTVDLGWFKIIGRPLLSLLQFFHGLVGNWGIAIILLTVLVKLATLYWTTKSMRSMKAMAVLAPKMKELKEKYDGDNAKIQQETMALYKHHGVNPLAGCLPIFLQMPIWIALYRMLSSASELYLQPFIPGWIGDLTARDPFYILPILVTVTMFVQTKMQPATGDNMQQKIMLYGMPLMFGVMGLFFPSGLTLYMLTNTLLSALHSLYMNKLDKPSLAMAAKIKESTEAAKAGAANKAGAAAASSGAKDEESSSQSKEPVASRGKNSNGNSKNKRRR